MKLVQLHKLHSTEWLDELNNKLERPSARAILTYINPPPVDFTFEVK
jgi:hypothetical protein